MPSLLPRCPRAPAGGSGSRAGGASRRWCDKPLQGEAGGWSLRVLGACPPTRQPGTSLGSAAQGEGGCDLQGTRSLPGTRLQPLISPSERSPPSPHENTEAQRRWATRPTSPSWDGAGSVCPEPGGKGRGGLAGAVTSETPGMVGGVGLNVPPVRGSTLFPKFLSIRTVSGALSTTGQRRQGAKPGVVGSRSFGV